MSREKNLAKNTLILSIGNFFPKLVGVVTLPILTGCLTRSEYGTYDLITTLVSLLLPIITLQVQSAAFRFLIECRDERKSVNEIVTNIFVFMIPITLVALVILFLCMPRLSLMTRILVCVYFFLDILYIALQQITRGLSYNLFYSLSAIFLSSVNLIMTVVLVWYRMLGINGVLCALVVAYLAGSVYLVLKIKKDVSIKFSLFSKAKIKELLNYSWPMVLNNLSSWILRMSDRLVITAFLGIEANALYAVANKIPNLLSMVQSTFTMAWQENASIASKDEDASLYYTSMFRSIYNIVSGFTAILIACTPILFIILVRGDYDEAYFQMPMLFLGMMFCCLAAFQGGIYVAYKHTKEVGLTTIAAAVCNLALDFMLVRSLGITAGSLSTLVSYLLLLFFRMHDLRKIVAIKYSAKDIMIPLFVLMIMCVISYQRVLILDIVNVFVGIVLCFVINRTLLYTVWLKVKERVNKGE
ncbi:O-antigen/teichoic acid export membrane protein [Lachnospiraceae bacterium PM6-15]|uniref:oligosaccharide flippase family protein n=1 Tax=Ohessyouella blattaphilus TaxID=2949333 RepID=UPI003E1A2D73